MTSNRHVVLREYRYVKHVSNYNMLSSEVARTMASDSLLQAVTFPLCECMYISPLNTFVPGALFAEQALRSYLNFIDQLDELDEIHSNKIKEQDGYSVFCLPSPLATLLKDKFKHIRFISQAAVLLHAAMQKREAEVLVVDFHQHFIDVVVQRNKQLLLSNSYDIEGITDALYYLTALIQKLGLSADAGCYLSGEVSKEDFELLGTYYPKLQVDYQHRMSLLIGLERSSRHNSLLMLNECV